MQPASRVQERASFPGRVEARPFLIRERLAELAAGERERAAPWRPVPPLAGRAGR